MKSTKFDAMRRYIDDLTLQDTMNRNTAREAWDTLHKALSSATKQFVPSKKFVGPIRDTPPWMSDKIKQKAQLKRLHMMKRESTTMRPTERNMQE